MPLHGSLKSALALLALLLLAMLFWQLIDQFQRTQAEQRQRALDYSTDLSAQVDSGMALYAQIGLNQMLSTPSWATSGDKAALLDNLRQALPDLHSVAWLDNAGRVIADSVPQSTDQDEIRRIAARTSGQAYYYSNTANGAWIYLLLNQPASRDGARWLLRLQPGVYETLTHQAGRAPTEHWLLENRQSDQVIRRDDGLPGDQPALSAKEREQSLMLARLSNSDWQLRTLYDAHQARTALLPALIAKLLLGVVLSLLPGLALLNLRRRQRELQAGRRRYQDIFEGTGVALCVVDLTGIQPYLSSIAVKRQEDLQQWLQHHPDQRARLLQYLRITEINQVAVNLLGPDLRNGQWQQLISGSVEEPRSLGYQIIEALLDREPEVELEIRLVDANGQDQHLWAMVRFPEHTDDHHAVIVSLHDITRRKQIELSLVERERFWSNVVSTVPDHLYVGDVLSQSMIYSNHHLGETLGYSKEQLQEMGEYFWETLLHPDDRSNYHHRRQLQRSTGYANPLHVQYRFRHLDGTWRRFDIREDTLARDSAGRVTRIIGVAKDITDQLEASESLRDSEKRYRMLAESISDVIFSTDCRLQLNYVSPSVQTVLGYDVQSIFDQGWQATIANPAQLTGLEALLERVRTALDQPDAMLALRSQMQTQMFLFDCLRADGRKVPIELRLVLVWDERDQFEGILGVGRDISQQRRAEKDVRMAATVFEHSTSAILITDPAGYIVQANDAFTRVSGYEVAQVLDELPKMLCVVEQQEAHLAYIIKQLNENSSWEGEVWLRRRSGEHYPAWVGITAVVDDEGDLASYVCFFSDISERKASEQRIHRLAYYDALTHLPNRTLFQDRLHTALQSAERQKSWVVLMFLDLDRFKPINDSLGHAAGDRMLKEMATRLLGCVDDDDTVARMGGDEFTLLLQPGASREIALNRAIHVAEQILGSLVKPFVLEGREFFVTASIGIALSPQDGNELSQLMKNADTAMYHAKERGKNNFQFYQADMNATALERLELESDLRHALEQEEFVLYYQPQFSGDGKRLTGTEALLRWRHPRRGLVPPGDFIPVLEELGLVVEVGDWVLTEACRQLKAWHAAKVRVPKVSVNISARQFSDGQLGTRIATILKETGLPPACLELELTESILMREVDEAMQILDSLKFLGLSIAVDDFGTGYSSLNYLKQFPIDVLKIDRSFVDGLPSGEQDAQIARAIIAMAHSLNLAVIAEGVETHEQLEFLREHGCDEVQGYLFGRPMPANRFEAQFSNDALFMFD